ncbi:hypothetical protein PAXINDRAFT_110204 [Paxillus involutus ATCC 200175]|nr:hypothetical protein PAXINDRAFT_110204 [Paxillus involutus ATCC 200175]
MSECKSSLSPLNDLSRTITSATTYPPTTYPPTAYPAKPERYTERPPKQQTGPISARPAPKARRPSEYHRKSHGFPDDRPLSPQPQPDRKRHQVFSLSFVLPSPERNYSLKDQNQVNQHNEHYMALRAKANEEGDLMGQSFQGSHEAYSRGEGARAKELSEKGKQHERVMENLNAEASTWIFRGECNDSKPGEIDLHGLYVKEAIFYTDKAIQGAQQQGESEIRLIVGKGLHSSGQVAKIRPAVEDLVKKHNLSAEVDPYNGGVLIVRLR